MTNVHDFTLKTLGGESCDLARYEGQVLLLVNVASKCGLTPQYAGLEALQQRFADRGFQVLGFPCNDFGAQEPGSEAEIQQFCSTQYDVTFPMFQKVHVLGEDKTPLYAHLTQQDTQPDGSGDIAWNFAKFLVGKDGNVIARFAPPTTPDDPAVVSAIEAAL